MAGMYTPFSSSSTGPNNQGPVSVTVRNSDGITMTAVLSLAALREIMAHGYHASMTIDSGFFIDKDICYRDDDDDGDDDEAPDDPIDVDGLMAKVLHVDRR